MKVVITRLRRLEVRFESRICGNAASVSLAGAVHC